jgi:hypothetical protein
MKKVLLSIMAIAVVALLPNRVMAIPFTPPSTTELTTDAAANVILPLVITQQNSLHFGTFSVSSEDGTVVVSTSTDRSATGGVSLSSGFPVSQAASYTVTGEADATYAVTLPTSFIISNGTSTLAISDVKANLANSGSDQDPSSGINGILTNGTEQVTVGATLSVPGGSIDGLYNGTFDIAVAYN